MKKETPIPRIRLISTDRTNFRSVASAEISGKTCSPSLIVLWVSFAPLAFFAVGRVRPSNRKIYAQHLHNPLRLWYNK